MLLRVIKYTFPIMVLALAIAIGLIYQTEDTFYHKELQNITRDSSNYHKLPTDKNFPLLENSGKLTHSGWSNRADAIDINFDKIRASSTLFNHPSLHSLRLKKWNAFSFANKKYIGLVAFFDLGYFTGNLLHIAKIDVNEKEHYEPKGYQYLNPYYGPTVNHDCISRCIISNWPSLNSEAHPNFPIKVSNLDTTERGNYFLTYKADFKNTLNKSPTEKTNLSIELDFKAIGKDKDSIVTLSPISEDSTLFYYNEKQYGLKANGSIKINDETFSASEFYIGHDIGRGVWPIKSGWNWVTANGKLTNGKSFGFNAGYGFVNPKARFSEDAFFVDNQMFKIPVQNYRLDNSKMNKLNFYNYVFTLTADENSCEMTFVTLNKNSNVISIPLDKTKFEVKYGKFVGYCKDEKGNKYEIAEAYGIIENKRSIW